MANQYCNLAGANRVKDEYSKINNGFAGVESDIDALIALIDALNTFKNSVSSSDVFNDSSVAGAKVKNALETLKNSILSHYSGSSDLHTTNNIVNSSSANGIDLTAALNGLKALLEAIDEDLTTHKTSFSAHVASKLVNDSTVAGAKISNALENLEGVIDDLDTELTGYIQILRSDINNLVINSGDNPAMVQQALVNTVNGVTYTTLQVRVDREFATRMSRYNTISSLVSNTDNLTVGNVVCVACYYSVADSATHYRIISGTNDGSGVQLNSGLWANIYHDGEVNAKWFGAFSSNSTDYKGTELQKFFDYAKNAKAKKFDVGDRDIYSNTPNTCVWTTGGGFGNFELFCSGGRLIYNIASSVPCLKIGVETMSYVNCSKIHIHDFKIRGIGNQSDVLKLYTKGHSDAAFWDSKVINISVEGNRGKGLSLYNGVFECQFDGIRINMRRKYEETIADPIVEGDIGLYLCNEENEDIISSLKFGFLNIWGGWHCIKTDNVNKYSPSFSADECHVFDSKREAMVLNNQNEANFINKLHIEFAGELGHLVHGCFWNGFGRIGGAEGGGDYMLGFVNSYNGYTGKIMDITLSTPYNMPASTGYARVYVTNGAITKVNRVITDLNIEQYSHGYLHCLVGSDFARIKLDNKTNMNINIETDKDSIYTHHEGVANRVSHTQVGFLGVSGGLTDQANMDFTKTTSIINWSNGNGQQVNTKLGFFGSTAIVKPTVSGSTGNNAALQSLLTQLANLGLITNSTT
jgi:hypothetical protein